MVGVEGTSVGALAPITLRAPSVLPADATVGDVRRFLGGGHVHLALVVAPDGRLLTCVDRGDLEDAGPDGGPAAALGRLADRVVPAHADPDEVELRMADAGARRLAVVDAEGRLVGLVCRKRSGTGFCTDEGVAARKAERRSGRGSATED